MKLKQILLLICIGFLFSYQNKEESAIQIKVGEAIKTIGYNGTYEFVDSDFELIFTLPKAESAVVEIACLTNKKIYDNYLKTKSLKDLVAFHSGNAYSVCVNAYGKVSSSLYLSNNGHQVLMYDGPNFSSFSASDSTETSYILKHKVDYFDDFRNKESQKIELKNIRHDTIYCIAQLSVYKNTKWRDINCIPFKLLHKK